MNRLMQRLVQLQAAAERADTHAEAKRLLAEMAATRQALRNGER